jgi:hypothetical protein
MPSIGKFGSVGDIHDTDVPGTIPMCQGTPMRATARLKHLVAVSNS